MEWRVRHSGEVRSNCVGSGRDVLTTYSVHGHLRRGSGSKPTSSHNNPEHSPLGIKRRSCWVFWDHPGPAYPWSRWWVISVSLEIIQVWQRRGGGHHNYSDTHHLYLHTSNIHHNTGLENNKLFPFRSQFSTQDFNWLFFLAILHSFMRPSREQDYHFHNKSPGSWLVLNMFRFWFVFGLIINILGLFNRFSFQTFRFPDNEECLENSS